MVKRNSVKKIALIGTTLLALSSTAFAADYTVDPDHSVVGFKIRHLAISTVPGRFGKFDGEFSFDPNDVAKSKVTATVSVASIDTAQKKRDDHLRTADFFDADKFPQMKFVSKRVVPSGDNEFKVEGELTIRDVTRPVTLDVEYEGTAKDMQGMDRTAFSAETKINRKDFGLTWSKVLDTGAVVVGDEVKIEMHIEGIKKS